MYRTDGHRRHFIASGLWAAVAGLSLLSSASAAGQAPKTHKSKKILVLGDSLSAEYGLKRGSGWVALLEHRLISEKIPATVINASISGDTTSGGRSRLGPLLAQHRPTQVIIELGGNDALRGLPLQLTRDNLVFMTQAAQNAGAKVLLIGMQVPPNYGKDYGERFAAIFASVAKERQAALVPFLLKGIADISANPVGTGGAMGTATDNEATSMFQADRIHPKEEAHPLMLANVWPELKKILQ